MTQGNAAIYMSFGRGGAGKGIKCGLTEKAFGNYAMKLDKTMLAPSKFESAEGPKSQRAQLENKCYVFSDEVKSIDSDTIKDWTGGSHLLSP